MGELASLESMVDRFEAVARELGLPDLRFSIVRESEFSSTSIQETVSQLSSIRGWLANPAEITERFVQEPVRVTPRWHASRTALVDVANKARSNSSQGFVSIAHSAGYCAAIAAPKLEDLIGIGIDIESLHRKPSFVVTRRIEGSMHGSKEPALIKWVRFEAAFKADPLAGRVPFADYRFESPGRFLRSGASIDTATVESGATSLALALAVCRS